MADKAKDNLIEQPLREYLWFSHGHQGLYGDDGEMQCGQCKADYKRDDINILVKKAIRAREEISLKKLSILTSKES